MHHYDCKNATLFMILFYRAYFSTRRYFQCIRCPSSLLKGCHMSTCVVMYEFLISLFHIGTCGYFWNCLYYIVTSEYSGDDALQQWKDFENNSYPEQRYCLQRVKSIIVWWNPKFHSCRENQESYVAIVNILHNAIKFPL